MSFECIKAPCIDPSMHDKNTTTMPNHVLCKDGSFDITNGIVAPCVGKGGEDTTATVPATTVPVTPAEKEMTTGEKWALLIGLTVVAYGIIYWSQKSK
jgi:hypothetical protein